MKSNRIKTIDLIIRKISEGDFSIGVIGLGYVGLPLIREFHRVGYSVTGFDIDPGKIASLKKGMSYIKHIPSELIKKMNKTGSFSVTGDFSLLRKMDAVIICVPTPLDEHREPDLSYVLETTSTIARYMKKGQLIILESTTYPGTTDEEMRVILEKKGMKAGKDFFLAYSPEREDPGNPDFSTSQIPKVVGGYTRSCLRIAKALYDTIVVKTIPVSSTRVAEATKLLENIYRAVNIALVNELKVIFERMDIDVWEVIGAAKTKPFGYHPFYPGPGLGGHCIPIDPFYLAWKAREYDHVTKFIELAGEVNVRMPYYVVQKAVDALNERSKSIKGAKILVLGIAYKKDVDDMRESPALKIIQLLNEKGAVVDYNDPYIPTMPKTRHYSLNMKSVSLTKANISKYDCVLIVTDHTDYDYSWIAENSSLIVDSRNVIRRKHKKVVKA